MRSLVVGLHGAHFCCESTHPDVSTLNQQMSTNHLQISSLYKIERSLSREGWDISVGCPQTADDVFGEVLGASSRRQADRAHISQTGTSVAEFDALRMTISAQIASKLHQTHFASPGTKAEAEGGSSLGGPAERELLDGRINVLLVYRVDY